MTYSQNEAFLWLTPVLLNGHGDIDSCQKLVPTKTKNPQKGSAKRKTGTYLLTMSWCALDAHARPLRSGDFRITLS